MCEKCDPGPLSIDMQIAAGMTPQLGDSCEHLEIKRSDLPPVIFKDCLPGYEAAPAGPPIQVRIGAEQHLKVMDAFIDECVEAFRWRLHNAIMRDEARKS